MASHRDTFRLLLRFAESRTKKAATALALGDLDAPLKEAWLAVATAAKVCPTLVGRRISPHTFRHTTAIHLLQSGVDLTVIALWFGHETPATTHLYVEADLDMKEQALKRVAEPPTRRLRYQAKDRLLDFLHRV